MLLCALVLALAARAGAQSLTRAPELVTFVAAPYPESELGEDGSAREVAVELGILIAVDGTVADVEVRTSGGAAFDEAAVAAARQFVFTPAEVDGAAAAIWISYRYVFEVEEIAEAIETADLVGVVLAGGEVIEGVVVRVQRLDSDPIAGAGPDDLREVFPLRSEATIWGNSPPAGRRPRTGRMGASTDSDSGSGIDLGSEESASPTTSNDVDTRVEMTDTSGAFSFLELPPGRYAVSIEGEGIVPAATEEVLVAGERLEVRYDVARVSVDVPSEGDDLELVVTAPALRRAVVSTEVRAEEARLVPGTSGDVVRVIESLPGVARATAGTGNLVVWGAAPEDTRTYVDGVPIPRLMHEGGLRSVIQPDFVTGIELLPGGYGPSYGRGLGGVVAVRTETPHDDDGLHGSLALDLLDASMMLRAQLDPRVHVAGAARVSLIDLFADAALGEANAAFVPVPRYRDGQLRGRFDLSDGDVLEVVGLLASDRFARGVPNPDPALAVSDTRALDFQRVYLTWTRDRGDGTEIVVTPYVGFDQRLSEATFGNVRTAEASETVLGGLRARLRTRITEWLSLEIGIDAEVRSTSLARTGSVGLPSREGDVRAFGQAPPDRISEDTWSVLSASVAPYVEADFSLANGALHVLPGVRLDPYVRSMSLRAPVADGAAPIGLTLQDFRAEPRLSIRFSPDELITLSAAGGLYHQPPSPRDLSASFGTPSLPLAQGLHAVLGASVQATETTSIEVTGFFTHQNALAMRSASSAPLAAQALVPSGEGRAYGAQLLLRQQLVEGLQGWIAYTLSRSERLDRDGAAWRLSDYDQTHVLTVVASYRIPTIELDVGLRFRVSSGYPRTAVIGSSYDAARDRAQPVFGTHNAIRLPEFVQLDLRIGRSFSIDIVTIDVFLEVLNVWDQPNVEEYAYAPDFSARDGVRGLPILPVLGIRGAM